LVQQVYLGVMMSSLASSLEIVSLGSQYLEPLRYMKLTRSSDWFRKETEDDSLQPTIDMLLNVSFFMWIGAVCPWEKFGSNSVIPTYRLVLLGILVLLFRRPPIILAMHKRIHQIEGMRHALFVGYFGPIGVSALFYLYVTREWLKNNVRYEDHERDDAEKLEEILLVVVWFLVICSIVCVALSEYHNILLTFMSSSSTAYQSRWASLDSICPGHSLALFQNRQIPMSHFIAKTIQFRQLILVLVITQIPNYPDQHGKLEDR
jgi:hypothetical protein